MKNSVYGLTVVELVSTGTTNKYKIVEKQGGYDVTAKYATAITTAPTSILNNVSAASYDSATETLTLTPVDNGTPSFKAPSALYTAGVKGIVAA